MRQRSLLKNKFKTNYYTLISRSLKMVNRSRSLNKARLKRSKKNAQYLTSNIDRYNSILNFRFFSQLTLPNLSIKLLDFYGESGDYVVSAISQRLNPVYGWSLFKLLYFYTSLKYFGFYNLSDFNKSNKFFRRQPTTLLLNFRRFRFFPNVQSSNGVTYSSLSLGLFSKFFGKGKSFIKNKSTFMVVASFLRKMLIFSEIKQLLLVVKRTPLYLQEILSTINTPVVNFYKNPFSPSSSVDESSLNRNFYFFMFIFINTKPFNIMKVRKKGRIKRKITKRIVKINRLVD